MTLTNDALLNSAFITIYHNVLLTLFNNLYNITVHSDNNELDYLLLIGLPV